MKLTKYSFLITLLFLISAFSASALTASFTSDFTAGCSPLVVHFHNTTSGATGSTTYSWDLGNGTTSTLTDVSGSYITATTYTVTLTATSGGTTSTATTVITVYPSPTVSFIATDTSVCPGTPVTFTSTTVSGVPGAVTYIWSFGDGSTSTASSPTHTYNTGGYYNVTLSVTNSQGCVSTLTVNSFMHVFTPAAPNFSAAAYYCRPPAHAVFSNFTTGSGPFSYTWVFGDGATSTLTAPTHDYMATGTYSVKLIVTDANGCTDSLTHPGYITVGGLHANFTFPSPVCLHQPVVFPNTSTSHISSNWNFGDGGTGATDSGLHIFNTAGTYTVRLIVFDGTCYDTITHPITVLPAPSGGFTFTPALSCPAPVTVSFTGSGPAGATYVWSFGDSTSGAGASTSHTYMYNGVDSVRMILTDGSGCRDTVVHVVIVHDMHLSVIPNVQSGCVPLSVSFTPSLTTSYPSITPYPSAITSYSWVFGDGATSTSASPTHIYTAVGIYHEVLTVTTANGCTTTDTLTISVGTPPTVTFTATPMHLCFNAYATFLATIVSGPVDVFYWDFGDGHTEVDSFPTITATHLFGSPGTFTVTLTPSYHGCQGAPYTVGPIIIDSPEAIIGSAYSCSPYTQVRFHDLSLGDDSHLWIFGDGTTSALDSPLHNYPAETIYTVRLATYNAHSGCHDTETISLNLIPPIPAMHVDDSTVCVGGWVHFSPTISGPAPLGYWWYLNGSCIDNDTSSTCVDTFHTWGQFSVRLVIIDAHGCHDTGNHLNWITVGHPRDSFSVSPAVGCAPLTVTLTDHTTDVAGTGIASCYWIYGDASSATVSTLSSTHVYTLPTTYTIKEIVTDNIGCTDSFTLTNAVTVHRPHAAFYSSTAYPCRGSNVHFTNGSTSSVASSYWMFGDGGTSTVSSPDHAYSSLGTYTVKLVVTDSFGCTDTATYLNYINVNGPHASFTMDDSFTVCPPLNVHFTNTSTGAVTYAWTLGDGTSSTIPSPSNLYTTSGLYTVRMIVTNVHGCRDTAYGHVNLYGYAGAFTYAPLSGCAPLTVSFHATVTNVPSIIWDFADGITSPATTVDSTTHTYTNPGSYVPKLILSDGTGCQNSSPGLDTIKVDGVFPAFTSTPVCVNTNFNFHDSSWSYYSTVNSWHWLFSTGDTSDLENPAFFYSTPGTYPVILTATDGWGCSHTVNDNVVVYPPPTITTSPDTTVCVGDAASLHGFGGVSYVWSPPATLSCTACQTTNASPAVVTTYTVSGTDSHGCVNIDSVTVFLRTKTLSHGWGDTNVCQNVPVQLFDTGATRYIWIPSSGLSSASVYDPIATPSVTTRYMIIAQLGSCIPDTNYVNLIIHPLPTVDAGPNQRLLAGVPAQLDATGTLINNYLWSPSRTLSCDTCANPMANMIITTTYTVDVESKYGCRASDSVTITVYCDESQVFIPNSFTPNGDGQNDVFYPRGTGISIIKAFRIYNRWGELLFDRSNIQINDASNAWDGSFNGAAPRPDVYVYIVEATCGTGQPINIKGDVTIIK